LNNPDIQKTVAPRVELSVAEKAHMIAEAREKNRRDEAAFIHDARKKGLAEGRARGRAEGEKHKAVGIARKMLQRSRLMEEIIVITGLSQQEVQEVEARIKRDFEEEARIYDAWEEGRAEGREEGRAKGRMESIKEIARNLLRRSRPMDAIVEMTGLSLPQVSALRDAAMLAKDAWEDGRSEGLAKGREEGRQEIRIEFARKLLRHFRPLEEISEATGLSMQEIRGLQTGMKAP